jgi:hypothetical protein
LYYFLGIESIINILPKIQILKELKSNFVDDISKLISLLFEFKDLFLENMSLIEYFLEVSSKLPLSFEKRINLLQLLA